MEITKRLKMPLGLLVLLGGILAAAGEDPAVIRAGARTAIDRGVAYLLGTQQASGAWSDTNFPALTAFPTLALHRSGTADVRPAIDRAVGYLRRCVRTDAPFQGAIFLDVKGQKGGGLSNYNTAIAMRALHEVSPDDRGLVLNARTFLARTQYLAAGLHHGGMGYDPPTGRAYADLSNSYISYEAMRQTQAVEDQRAGGRVDLDWKAAVVFVEHCQNDPRFNTLPWASDDVSEQGGFAYQPDTYRPTAGAYEKNGVLKYRTMTGMSYAGILSYLNAGIPREDPRVQAAVRWVADNWNLDIGNRNPEMVGKAEAGEGLFYMYEVMAKALDALGQETLVGTDGREIRWREALIAKLVALQDQDGSWINPNSRYMEADRNLVTAYALIALEIAAPRRP